MEIEKHQPRTFLGVIKEVFDWYPSSYPAHERKLLFKLDLSILIFACLCFFTKYLDQSNISNAYTSGIKEDLKLYGNELNYFNVMYFTAYVIAQIPMLLLISRPKLARFMLPTLEIGWGILTFAQSRVTDAKQLYVLRFFVGLLEAPVFAGTHFILGSWYKKNELFKRAGTWFICNSLGTMVSGYLQAAAYTNLSGVAGMSGWRQVTSPHASRMPSLPDHRWLFIIDGIFTIPAALAGYIIFPGIPESPKPVFLTDADIALAKERMEDEKVRPPGKLDLNVFKRSLGRWHIYVFVFCYMYVSPIHLGTGYLIAESSSFLKLHDHFFLPHGIYEPLAQGRELLRPANQQAANRPQRHHHRRILARHDASCYLPVVCPLLHLHGRVYLLLRLHDGVAYTERAEVSTRDQTPVLAAVEEHAALIAAIRDMRC
ncbi:Major facilitator superfamily [Macrophomina phaseolina MS6]|uniref:Major facilitator superfamily n=1 Tax=Macrophomina phaseolina (strain MS6) TaxID=1126212 RepID=K2RYY4_MACPH|nr:Major facilitator superfamily [Macrophomina phaseolina MS6]